uniref:Uncharacterized protein n=1 Tax=Meloidogyne enterolobii TaxID=390850 RepID=A0A6V7UFD1_MELEN|nr:unnamed protein product [Meloidogyne enterolobii]
MRNPNTNPNFRGPSNPIRSQNPQPMRSTMQNRGTGGNPNFGSRMNNPTFPQQGQLGGASTFGQSTPYSPQMFPNSVPPNMPGVMNQTNRGATNSNSRLINSNPRSMPPNMQNKIPNNSISSNNPTKQMPPNMHNNGIGGGINNPNFGSIPSHSILPHHNPQFGGPSQFGGNNDLNSHNGPQPGYGQYPQDPSMFNNHGFTSGHGYNPYGGYNASNSNHGTGGMNNFNYGTGQQTFQPQQMVPHQMYPNMPSQVMPQPIVPYTGNGIYNPSYTPQPARDDYAESHQPKGYCAISGKPLYDNTPQHKDEFQQANFYGNPPKGDYYFDDTTNQWIPYNPAPQHHEENGNDCTIM